MPSSAAYRSGVGSITDLTLAETELLQARNAHADACSTALSAAATLALAAVRSGRRRLFQRQATTPWRMAILSDTEPARTMT
jgi:outer membrane protein TolC